MIRRMNDFLGLVDGEDAAPWTDFLFLYGVLAGNFIGIIYFTIQLITF